MSQDEDFDPKLFQQVKTICGKLVGQGGIIAAQAERSTSPDGYLIRTYVGSPGSTTSINQAHGAIFTVLMQMAIKDESLLPATKYASDHKSIETKRIHICVYPYEPPPAGKWTVWPAKPGWRPRWVRGVTREVFLLGPLAFKLPSFRGWRLFLTGILANLHEKLWWRETDHDHRLNPAWFCLFGFLLVARRIVPLVEGDTIGLERFAGLPLDTKPGNFGWASKGYVVLLDYGN